MDWFDVQKILQKILFNLKISEQYCTLILSEFYYILYYLRFLAG